MRNKPQNFTRTLLKQRNFTVTDSTLKSVPEITFTSADGVLKGQNPSLKRISAVKPPAPKNCRSISVGIRPFGSTLDLEPSDLFKRFDLSSSSIKVAVGRKTSNAFQKRPRRCSEVIFCFVFFIFLSLFYFLTKVSDYVSFSQ